MVESKFVSEASQDLSTEDRLWLIRTLNTLPSAQFGELVFGLNPPKGNVPGSTAPQADRTFALLEWVESPIGPGISKVEDLLNKIVTAQSKTDENLVSFAISGKVSEETTYEVRAIVQLLRQKTGDESIDVAFFRPGSIKIILSGSPESLKKLEELFESGELTNFGTVQVEAVNRVDSSTTDSRKARLIQVLKLQGSDPALDLARVLARALARTLDLARDRVFDRDRDATLDLARDRVRDLVRDLDCDSTLDRNIDLANIDLSGANLRDLDLIGVDLTATDLTGADVSGTIFGNNLGLTESDKRGLTSRGAIFQEPPNSDVPSLVLR
jgi:Pentapeptide repeats (8 copies)